MKSVLVAVAMVAGVLAGGTTWGDSSVPEGYRPLEYFDLDGAQWVDTGYFPKCTDRLEMTVALPPDRVRDAGTYYALWCTRNGSGAISLSAFLGASSEQAAALSAGNPPAGALRFDRNTPGTTTDVWVAPGETSHVVVADYGAGACTVDGEAAYTFPNLDPYIAAGRLVLFASHKCGLGLDAKASSMDGNWASYRFFRFRVFDKTGTLQRDYVPVCKLDETDPLKRYGIYECVTGAYCTNNGTRPFQPSLETVVLTEDTDLTGAEAMSLFDKRYDLNGYRLTLGAFVPPLGVTNSSVDCGELRLSCPTDRTITEMTVGGNLTVVKDGAGTLTLAGGTFGGAWRVAAGTLAVGCTFNGITATAENPLVVDEGAVFSILYSSQTADRLSENAQVVVNGGELRLNGANIFWESAKPNVFVTNGTVTVVNDHEGGDVKLGNLTLASSVLRFEGTVPGYGGNHGLGLARLTTTGECRYEAPADTPNLIWKTNSSDTGLEVDVVSGTLHFGGKYRTGNLKLRKMGAGRLLLEPGAAFEGNCVDLINGVVTVNDVWRSVVTTEMNVGPAATADLTEAGCVLGHPDFVFGLANDARNTGSVLTLDVHGRTLANGEPLVRFASCPTNLTFALDAATVAAGGTFTVGLDGVYYGGAGVTAPHTAIWTGEAGDGNVANPANWSCANVAGEPLTQVAATAETWIGDVTLEQDLDWRALGTLHLAGTVNLNGHRLQVAGLKGPGQIVDGRYDLTTTNGEAHITVDKPAALDFRKTPIPTLFNDNPFYTSALSYGQRIIVEKKNLPFSIDYDFGEPTLIDSYRMLLSDSVSRNPSDWTFSGSVDGTTWTELDNRTGVKDLSRCVFAQYDFANETAYRFYRLTLQATPGNQYVELCQLEYGRQSATPGELVIDVPAGTTNINATVALNGNFKVVKAGAGTFVAAYANQTYAGGTDVTAGTFTWGTGLFPAGMGKIAVSTGSTLDMNGQTDPFRLDYPLELAGTVRQQYTKTGDAANTGLRSFGNITLTEDATIAGKWFYFGRCDGVGAQTGWIQFNGHRLTFDLCDNIGLGKWASPDAETGSFAFVNTADDGSCGIAESLEVWNFGATPCTFGPRTMVRISHSFRTADFSYANTQWQGLTWGCGMRVVGHYAPGAFYPPVIFENGATFDLSAVSGVFDADGVSPIVTALQTVDQIGTVSFETNVTVTVDVHGRTFAAGEQIVKWSAPLPEGVSFVFDAETATGGIAPFATDAGLYYGEPERYVDTAEWTGAAGDGDLTNPLNWTCKDVRGNTVENALPGATASVTVEGQGLRVQFPAGTTPAYRELTIGDCSLACDCDWRGIDSASIKGTIDLKGNKLSVTGLDGTWKCTDASGYDLIEYLNFNTSDATKGQKIHLDYTPLSTDRLDARFMITKNIPNGRFYGIWCARNSKSGNTYTCFASGNGGNKIRYDYNGGTLFWSTAFNANEIQTVAVVPSEGKAILNDLWWAMSSANFTVGSGLVVGASHSGGASFGHYSDCRIYGFKITGADGTVKADFVPARRLADGELGLLNLLTYEFKTNSGNAGTLGAGPTLQSGIDRVGELHVAIPDDGTTYFNNGVALVGMFKLVLEGPGRFAANRANQYYHGGTVVAGGVATTYHYPDPRPAANHFWGAPGTRITVEAGAEFNMKGLADYHAYHEIVLAGGRWTDLDGINMNVNSNGLGAMTLTDDSEIEANRNIYFRNAGVVDLGGHTLTITLPNTVELGLHNSTVFSNGTVVVRGGKVYGFGTAVHAETATFVFEDGYIYQGNPGAPLNVGGYTAGEAPEGLFNRGVEAINVFGRFTPASDDFFGCTLQNGASIDLSGLDGTWSMTSPSTQGFDTVTVAPGATVTIELGTRNLHGNLHIIAWNEEPQNVTWQLDEASRKYGYRIEIRDDGLHLTRGLTLFFR